MPEEIEFQTKPEIALTQLRAARSAGLPAVAVLADAAYGNDGKFRAGITAEELRYAVGVFSGLLVWRPGEAPPPRTEGSRRPRRKAGETRLRPVQVKTLAMEVPADAWQTITWREGSNAELTSRFARLRVRPAPQAAGRGKPAQPAAEEWLLIEWEAGEAKPTRYWLSILLADIAFERLVDLTKLRWRIERDYLELKQEVGLGHYEDRGWRGFHHHASLCIAAYGFLISERETIPPSGRPRTGHSTRSAVPAGYPPRGASAAHPAPHAKLDRYLASGWRVS